MLPKIKKGFLNLPGGHAILKETMAETAARELQEETGLDPLDLDIFHIGLLKNSEAQLHVFGTRINEYASQLQYEMDVYYEDNDLDEKPQILPINEALYGGKLVPNTVYMVHDAMKHLDNWRLV